MKKLLIAFCALSLCSVASAHVVFDTPQATLGKTYRAVLRVSHGCEGSPTTKLSVDLPAGFVGAKPQPKPGWKIETVTGPYDRAYQSMHRDMAEGVKTITWSGGSLPNDFTDEFIFFGQADKSLQAGTSLYFPVVQTCEKGEHRWVQVPAAGQNLHALEAPAAALLLVAGDPPPAPEARSAQSGSIAVDKPWSRATPGGAKVAAGYLTITNSGSTEDRLVSVTTDIAGRGEIHEMAVKDGVMTMRPLANGLTIPAGGSVTLKPGSFHLMYQDLKQPLKEGEHFSAVLTFEKAGPIPVTFDVQGIAATSAGGGASSPSMSMPGMDHGAMDHDHMKGH